MAGSFLKERGWHPAWAGAKSKKALIAWATELSLLSG
jgi:hypothetical protein